MGYYMKRGNSGVKFSDLGSSPAKQSDMTILREKQARSSKGVSEYQHFKNPESVDINEPRVEYWMKESSEKEKEAQRKAQEIKDDPGRKYDPAADKE